MGPEYGRGGEMLFDMARIGPVELPSRLVMPPLETNLALGDGSVSQRTLDYYERRARGGPGLIVVECTSVDPVHFHRNQLNISDDRFIAGLSRLAAVIKRHGVPAAIQIQHPGRQLSLPSVQSVAPSAVACRAVPRVPRELSVAEIGGLVQRFGDAARRARDAGFDAVQFHGAHGYLIAQFMSAWSNRRTDRYGGDVYGRATFPLEVIADARRKVGGDYPLIFRLSGEEHVPGGRDIDESRALARLLERAGIDAISVSAGTFDSGEWTSQPMLMPRGCLVPLAAAIKGEVGVPVIAVGRIHTPRLAEDILRQGKADLIAMGRPLSADPDLPRKALEGRTRDIRHCISCNTCMLSLSTGPVTCLMNPGLGREGTPEVEAPTPRSLLVVNGGPAGIEAARVAALRGHRVRLWDESGRLGGRWSWLLKPYIRNRLNTLAELGVAVELGREVTAGAIGAAQPDVVVAGRGLKPAVLSLPGIDAVPTVYAGDVLGGAGRVSGRHVVILGAGSAGFEAADFLVRKGHEIDVIAEGPALGQGVEPLTRNVMRRLLVSRGVTFHRNARVERIGPAAVEYVDEQGLARQTGFDCLLLAHDWEPDETLVESLRGLDCEIVPVGPYQHPAQYVRAFREGSSIGRDL